VLAIGIEIGIGGLDWDWDWRIGDWDWRKLFRDFAVLGVAIIL